MIVVGSIGGKNFHLSDEQLLLFGGQLVPGLQEFVRPGFELGVRGNHPQFLLVGKNLVTQFVVTLVKQMHGPDFSTHSLVGW